MDWELIEARTPRTRLWPRVPGCGGKHMQACCESLTSSEQRTYDSPNAWFWRHEIDIAMSWVLTTPMSPVSHPREIIP